MRWNFAGVCVSHMSRSGCSGTPQVSPDVELYWHSGPWQRPVKLTRQQKAAANRHRTDWNTWHTIWTENDKHLPHLTHNWSQTFRTAVSVSLCCFCLFIKTPFNLKSADDCLPCSEALTKVFPTFYCCILLAHLSSEGKAAFGLAALYKCSGWKQNLSKERKYVRIQWWNLKKSTNTVMPFLFFSIAHKHMQSYHKARSP